MTWREFQSRTRQLTDVAAEKLNSAADLAVLRLQLRTEKSRLRSAYGEFGEISYLSLLSADEEREREDLGGRGIRPWRGRGTSFVEVPLPLQTSLSLQELSPRQPQWYFVRIFDKGRNEAVLWKVFFVFGRYGLKNGLTCRLVDAALRR